MTPTEKRSERPSTGRPRICSGDMYAGVPSTVPDLRELRRVDMRDAEVRDLDRAVGQHEHVRRLDVAVDDAELVRVAERRQDLRQDAHDVGGRKALVLLEVAP